MGADIKQLRTRIKSVDSTLHLTKAMGLVASSKIRRATDSMHKGREFASALDDLVSQLVNYNECAKSPYMANRKGDRLLLLVIAGDRGLAGGYNANIFRLMRNFPDAEIIPVGKRACDRYSGSLLYAEDFSYRDSKQFAETICRRFVNGEIDRFGIVFTEYKSMLSQEACVKWILPLTRNGQEKSVGAIFEPDERTVLDLVVPEYIAGMISAAVKESFLSEVAARRVAMDNAGKNAQEMIDDLGLKYNRARQGAITQEITEIVAGSGL